METDYKQESIKIHECFSGNTPKDIQKKAATLSLFNEGISHYLDKSFNKAHEVFTQVIKENPEDRTAAFFFTNTKQVMEEGFSKNREGIVEMQEKWMAGKMVSGCSANKLPIEKQRTAWLADIFLIRFWPGIRIIKNDYLL